MDKHLIVDVAIAVGTIGSAVAAVTIGVFGKKIWRPKLKVHDFKMEWPYVTKTKIHSPSESVPAYFFNLKITNTVNRVAKRCEGYVCEIRNEMEKIEFIPLQLQWALKEGKGFTSLNPGQDRYLNTIFVEEGVPKLWFRSLFQPSGMHRDITSLDPGNYEIVVKIYSENAGVLSVTLFVNWDGKWSDDYNEMIKNNIKISIKS